MVEQYQSGNYQAIGEEPRPYRIDYGHGPEGPFTPVSTGVVTKRSRFSGPAAGEGLRAMLENPRPRKTRRRR